MMNILDELDMGKMGMDRTSLKMGSRGNCITKLNMDAYRSVLGIVTKLEGKVFLRSAPIEGHITVRTMPLYWREERGHRWLGVMLTSLGKMERRH